MFPNHAVQCTQFPVLIGLTVALGRADGADGRVVPAAEEGNDDEDDHAGHRRDCHLHHTVGLLVYCIWLEYTACLLNISLCKVDIC